MGNHYYPSLLLCAGRCWARLLRAVCCWPLLLHTAASRGHCLAGWQSVSNCQCGHTCRACCKPSKQHSKQQAKQRPSGPSHLRPCARAGSCLAAARCLPAEPPRLRPHTPLRRLWWPPRLLVGCERRKGGGVIGCVVGGLCWGGGMGIGGGPCAQAGTHFTHHRVGGSSNLPAQRARPPAAGARCQCPTAVAARAAWGQTWHHVQSVVQARSQSGLRSGEGGWGRGRGLSARGAARRQHAWRGRIAGHLPPDAGPGRHAGGCAAIFAAITRSSRGPIACTRACGSSDEHFERGALPAGPLVAPQVPYATGCSYNQSEYRGSCLRCPASGAMQRWSRPAMMGHVARHTQALWVIQNDLCARHGQRVDIR